MNQQSEHLSNAQIEAYGERTSSAGPEQDERNEGQRVDAHLDDCPSCRARVLDFQRTRLAPHADTQVKQAATPDCPSEDDLRQLVAGLCSDAMATKFIHHAATCDHCGPLLKTYTEDFSDDFTSEEQAVLDSLQSSSATWQKDTARKMLAAADTDTARASAGDLSTGTTSSPRATPEEPSGAPLATKPPEEPDRKLFSWKWVFVPATAAAVAATAAVVICGAVGFGIWYARRDTPEKVEKLLAQAYTEQRTIEMRWPGAEWGVMREARGLENSRFSRPDSLRQAAGIVARHRLAIPGNVEWLRRRAEVEVLEGHPESAIVILSPALEARPDSVPLMLDSAISFFQRGVRSGSREDLDKAINLLTNVVKRDPSNSVALFDLAVAYTQIRSWDRAAATWDAYLQLDPDGPWAQEAKQKRDLAKSNLP